MIRPVLQQSCASTAPSVQMSNQQVKRNGFAPYRYKVSVNEIVASANNTDNQFVLPGYHAKLPAPFTDKDKPRVLSMNRDEGKRDFISFYQKLHKLDPGPKYDIGLDMSKKDPTLPNAKIYKISPSKIPNFIASVEKLSKLTPGPGMYK